jgi:hypothetical protein
LQVLLAVSRSGFNLPCGGEIAALFQSGRNNCEHYHGLHHADKQKSFQEENTCLPNPGLFPDAAAVGGSGGDSVQNIDAQGFLQDMLCKNNMLRTLICGMFVAFVPTIYRFFLWQLKSLPAFSRGCQGSRMAPARQPRVCENPGATTAAERR